MITTQRLIIIVIVMNLVLGWASAIYTNPSSYVQGQMTEEQDYLVHYETTSDTNEFIFGGVQRTETQEEPTVIDSFRGGWVLIDIFINAINPLSINRTQFTREIEKIFADFLMLVRSLFILLMIFEAYLVYKNKKGS